MKKATDAKPARSSRVAHKEKIVLGGIVAEREYRIGDRRVRLQIGTPHRDSLGPDWYCPFRIIVGRKRTRYRALGVDAVQALQLSFDRAKVELEALSSRLTWEGSEKRGDIGIYRRLTGFGIDFDRHLEAILDRELRAWAWPHKRTSPGARPKKKGR